MNRLDLTTGLFTHYTATGKKDDIAYYNVHGLLALDNRLFVGMFYNGMDIMDTRTGKVTDRFKVIKDSAEQVIDFVSCIYLTRDSTILVGSAYHGASLLSYNPVTKTFKRVPQIPYNSYTWDIRQDSKGNIWTGSVSRGAYYYHPKTGEQGNIRFGDTVNNTVVNEFAVYSIWEDHKGFLWFATTGGGLIKVGPDKKIVKKFGTKTGLPSNVLYSILEDNSGNLWISSLKGLICFNTITEKIKVYTQANGLLTDQFNYNSAYKHTDGSMYFGSVKGMIAFDPAAFSQPEPSPPTYITGFQINNKDVEPGEPGSPLARSIFYTDTLVLNHDQNNFSIEFAALNYSSPQVTRYKFRMKGMDDGWTYLNTNRKAFFTDLTHGDYEFIVQAESNTGSWLGKERRLFIRIRPPFWKSNIAYLFYILLLAAAVFISTRMYRQNLERKNLRKLQLFEHEKEKEIYQAKIEFFTHITHEIQTPLTLISGPIEWLMRQFGKDPEINKSLTIAEKNTRRLVSLTSQLLDFRKTEANQFSLNFVKTDITALITDVAEGFKQQAEASPVRLELQAPAYNFMAFVDREAFIKICSNLISNALKYAATYASIVIEKVEEKNGYFTIYFNNDGKGIPPEYRQQIFEPFVRVGGDNKPGTGIGLSLARSLTELHNGTLQLLSGERDQVCFELRLPIHQEIEFQLGSWKKTK
ncbi:sensor histidine kinase [Niabella hibiscisoli]|uniref:sensor histidine kinase n=1 Tax=Niabella hibiscisoli TaxID=1825928 RepID=UPI001F0E1DB7|nr:ATP-binding protein [Niabella hibiscisoli]MCH5718536.1 ATP-binding protein [Niabella hibiscisoli]